MTSKTDPLGKSTSLTYYNDGKLQSVTDRNNYLTTISYTPSGKTDTIEYHDLSTVSFDYDTMDNLTQMIDPLGTTTFQYDLADQLISKTDPHGITVSFEYDEAANISAVVYPGGKRILYTSITMIQPVTQLQ